MPVIIQDAEWSQTENVVTIKVPLRGVHQSKVDIFYCHSYIKASFEHYFYEAFLLYPIKPKDSSCTLTATHILFELIKSEPQTWENLEMEIAKTEKQHLKMKYIAEEHQRIQEEQQELKNRKSELKRLAVREQMALDTKQREAIENIKNKEKQSALKEIDHWKDSHKSTTKNIQRKRVNVVKENPPAIPPPRSSSVINVSFTPREFPTPCRESRMEEENEWLRKQAEARRSVGFISEDLRPEEHNPQFLKNKGDDFLRNRNYLAAISAYSFGIKLNDKFADLYVGRSEAHLALGNYNKAIQDCSRALELMKPEVPLNLKERAACIGRRGIALINLQLVKEGISELKASVTLVPNEEFSFKLREAIERLNETSES